MSERRKDKRLDRVLPLKLSDPEFDVLTETRNISASGAYCLVDKALPLMTKLSIVILITNTKSKTKEVKKICCQGVVVRQQTVVENNKECHYVGIFFSDITDKDRRCLVNYINSFFVKTVSSFAKSILSNPSMNS